MKHLLNLLSCFFMASACGAQARYWIGNSSNWNSTANWSLTSGGAGGASVPAASNDVIFDQGNSVIVEMDILTTTSYDIRSLAVINNTTIVLKKTQANGGTRALRVSATGTSPRGLQVDNGSSLTIDAINTAASGNLYFQLALTGNAGVTGLISGNLFFKGSGTASTCNAQLLLQSDASHFATLTVAAGGMIKYFDNTDNTSPGSGNYLGMQAGSVYEINKNGGSFPPGNWDPMSLAKVTGVTGAAPTFLGSTYGNLEWNSPLQSVNTTVGKDLSFNHINLINTGAPLGGIRLKGGSNSTLYTLVVNGDLQLSAAAKLELTGGTPPGGGAVVQVKGNVINNGSITESSSALINRIEFTGASNQNVSGTGAYTGNELEWVMNGAGVTLLSPVTLPYRLTLTNGKIKTNATGILSLANAATVTGGNPNSFVEGPMKKGGADNSFTFPVGIGSIYAPVTYSSTALTPGDTIRAEYLRANPQTTYGNNYDPSSNPLIDHISFVEYWKVQKMTGAPQPHTLTTTIGAYSFCSAINATHLAQYTPATGNWIICPTASFLVTGNSGSFELGTITTASLAGIDSIFTFATNLSFTGNPLPLTLTGFTAKKMDNSRAIIRWQVAQTPVAGSEFELQKAVDDLPFYKITAITPDSSLQYYFIDAGTGRTTRYRLRMINPDRTFSYSPVALLPAGKNTIALGVPAQTSLGEVKFPLSVDRDQTVHLLVHDMQGRLVYQMTTAAPAGSSTLRLYLPGLPSGLYHARAITMEGLSNSVRFRL